jgi:hypothetical protein
VGCLNLSLGSAAENVIPFAVVRASWHSRIEWQAA